MVVVASEIVRKFARRLRVAAAVRRFCIGTMLALATTCAFAASGGGAFLSGLDEFQVDASGTAATVSISGITNTTEQLTGSLQFELFFTSAPYSGGGISGSTAFTVPLSSIHGCGNGQGQLALNQSCTNISIPSTSFTPPAPGTYYAVLVLLEYAPQSCPTSTNGYCVDDAVNLTNLTTGGSTFTFGGSGGGPTEMASHFCQVHPNIRLIRQVLLRRFQFLALPPQLNSLPAPYSLS